jgi:hypothetical protein
LVIVTVAALFATLALAQKNSSGAPKYDFAAETKIKGTIEEVKDFECPVSGGLGAHLVLKSGDKPVIVHLALSKFLKEYDFSFKKGEEVEVIGVRTKLDEQDAILARQVIRGNSTFTFRDNKGKPLW